MKLDNSFTEGIDMTWKVTVEILFLDSTMLSLDDDHFRLRSKVCAALGLMRKHDPQKGYVPDHHGVYIECSNCVITGWIESDGEGIRKSIEKMIRLLNKRMSEHHGATVNQFHLNFSSDRLHNGSFNQKNYQDYSMHFHGILKNNQFDFCKKET